MRIVHRCRSASPGRADAGAVSGDGLEAGGGGYPGGGAVGSCVDAQFAVGRDEGDVAGVQHGGGPVQGHVQFADEDEQDLFPAGAVRDAAQVGGGTVSCQAQSCSLPREGAT